MSNELTVDDIVDMQSDPIVAVSKVLSMMKGSMPNTLVVDPSNPLVFQLEAIAFNATVLREEINTKHARRYPRLANAESDLYNNMSYIEYRNVFSQPANNTFRFRININNFRAYAIDNGTYKMVSIPEMSTITVEGYTFLIANRIDIKEFKNGVFSIEQNVSKSGVGVSNLGVLPHGIYLNDNNNEILYFDTILKQLSYDKLSYNVNKGDSFLKAVTLVDDIHFITATITRGTYTYEVKVSYSEIIDYDEPTIIIKKLSNAIEINIPDVYIINDSAVGTLTLHLYTTKGEVEFPLNKIPDNLFVLKYTNINDDEYTAVINNLNIGVNALYRLTNGSNGKSFSELRDSIVSNSIGDTSTPVTKVQLLDSLSRSGYYGYLRSDTITSRMYVASKTLLIQDIPNIIDAKPDILMYKAVLAPMSLVETASVVVSNVDDRMIIKPNTLFKSINGVVTPLSDTEVSRLNNFTNKELLEYLNSTDILFSPYSYISSIHEDTYSLRIVDFESSISAFNIIANNVNIVAKSNIKAYSIQNLESGYRITISLATNAEFENLDKLMIRAQLGIPIADSNAMIYLDTEYVEDVGFVFDINTDFYVDKDIKLSITNGYSTLSHPSIDLNTKLELVTYYQSNTIEFGLSSMLNDKLINSSNNTAITLESMDVIFGTELTHLYTNMNIAYSDREYLRHNDDVYAKYDTIVYDTDSVGSLLTPNDNKDALYYTIKYNVGDIMLDEDSNPIILHNAGDIVLDINGNPVVDYTLGVVKYIDVLLLEYTQKIITASTVTTILDTLKSYYNDMKVFNMDLLGETTLVYKPFRNNDAVKFNYNNTYKSITRKIRPMVEFFIESNVSLGDEDLIKIKNVVGASIHQYINKDTFYSVDIKELIMESLNMEISSIRIVLDRAEGSTLATMEKVRLSDLSNRFHIAKVLTELTGINRLVYDVEVKITRI